MVRSITGTGHSQSNVDVRRAANLVRVRGRTRVGETENFIVDFDGEENLVIVYGKEVQTECQFKLAFDKDDIEKIVGLLKKACDFFH
jgi:hypothetical protein